MKIENILFLWGFKTRVSKIGFKTDIKNPKIEKLSFCLTSTDPVNKETLGVVHKPCLQDEVSR